MHPDIEQDLIRKSQQGDQKSFRRLVEHHQGLAYSIAFRFVRDKQEAEDIVQDAFVKVWKNLSGYNDDFKLKTWIAKIVTNLCLDFLKSARNRNQSLSLDAGILIGHSDHKLETEELTQIVWRLAEQLTDKQKSVFVLRDLQMLEVNEVCEILGMSEGNIKSNLYYARLKIKEGLQRYYLL